MYTIYNVKSVFNRNGTDNNIFMHCSSCGQKGLSQNEDEVLQETKKCQTHKVSFLSCCFSFLQLESWHVSLTPEDCSFIRHTTRIINLNWLIARMRIWSLLLAMAATLAARKRPRSTVRSTSSPYTSTQRQGAEVRSLILPWTRALVDRQFISRYTSQYFCEETAELKAAVLGTGGQCQGVARKARHKRAIPFCLQKKLPVDLSGKCSSLLIEILVVFSLLIIDL